MEEDEEGLEELVFSPSSSFPEKGLKGTRQEEGEEEEEEVVGEEELSFFIWAGRNLLDNGVSSKVTFGGCEGKTALLRALPFHGTKRKGLPVGPVLDTRGAPRVGHSLLLLLFDISPT